MGPGMRFFFSRIFPLPFVIAGAATLYFGVHGIILANASAKWPTARGKVLESKVEQHSDSDGTTYHAEILYEFSVEDVIFKGNRVSYGDYGSSSPSHANRVVNNYPKGKKVEIHYMPEKPEECLLEPGLKGQSFFMPLFGLIFFGVGCLMVVFLPRLMKKEEMATTARLERLNNDELSGYADPAAAAVDWSPLKSGGTNFRTHKLIKTGLDRMEFRAAMGAKIFYLIFFLIGLGLFAGFSIAEFQSEKFDLGMLLPIFVGLVFTLVGGGLFYHGTLPIVFDKKNGYFWKGRKSPDKVFSKSVIKHLAELDNIYALQLLSEHCSGNESSSSYYSYELNLVLKTGERINVVDHGNANKLREDATILADFLDKPVWDRT